jgi:hypothetical protein
MLNDISADFRYGSDKAGFCKKTQSCQVTQLAGPFMGEHNIHFIGYFKFDHRDFHIAAIGVTYGTLFTVFF